MSKNKIKSNKKRRKVPSIDYRLQFKKNKKEILKVVRSVLSRGDLILRQQLEDFEDNFARFVGVKYAIGVGNGTDALQLALRACGVKAGDEVITVSHTFVATVSAIHFVGAKPVLIDIDDDHNMNANLIEHALTSRTKAIIPVHLNGRVCHMDQILKVAHKNNLIVIEDAAQAIGATYKKRNAGSFGAAGCFSFYPSKILGGFGDGGMVVTNQKKIMEKVRLLRNHCRNSKGNIVGWGQNSRLDNLQAALLNLKLKAIHKKIKRRREIASLYQEGLASVHELTLPPAPEQNNNFFDVYQNYEILAKKRKKLLQYLKDKNIEIMIAWGGKGVHQMKSLNFGKQSLPETNKLFRNVLSLPIAPELTNRQINYVIQVIKEFYTKY